MKYYTGYEVEKNHSIPKRKSKCPRGAPIGDTGIYCGSQCTGACCIENN